MSKEKITVMELAGMFPDNKTAEEWLIKQRWVGGIVACPHCQSKRVSERATAKRAWRCKDCRKDFSIRTGTVMHGSNLDFKTWVWAIYLITTNIKGIARTKMASDLGIRQATAWHLAMRLRETFNRGEIQLANAVEVDETYR